jgi:hypothetical protein
MKAIINVKKASQYSKLNGQAFEVKDVFEIKGIKVYGLLGVNPSFPNNQTDFSANELIIQKS